MGWLVAATLLAAGLRCFRLGQNSLWVDEYMSLTTAYSSLIEMPAAALRDHALNPPIYFWILHLVVRTLGEGEAAVRLPSVVAGILTIPVIWLLAREVTRSVGVANLSALLLATHPLHVWYSQEARPYALLLLFSSAALFTLAVALRSRGPWWWAGFAAWSGLAMLTHVFGVIPLAVGALWVGFRARDRGVLFRYAGAALGALALTTPYLIMLVRAAATAEGTGSPQRPPTGMEVPYTIYAFVAGYSFGPSVRELQDLGGRAAVSGHLVPVALVSGALVALGWLAVRLRSDPARDLAVLVVVPLGAAVAASLVTTKSYNVRYALPALIGFIPLVALALARLPPTTRRLGSGGLLGLFLWSDAQWFATPAYRKEDSRAAVACLGHVLPPDATVLVAPAYMAGVLAHYSARGGTSLRIVGINQVEDLTRFPRAEALLLTRLSHVPDPAGLYRAFAGGTKEPDVPAGVIGYRVYLADLARASRPGVCRSDG